VRHFFKQFAQSECGFRNHPIARRLGPLLEDPHLFHINRRSVASAFAIGLTLMWVPIPLQTFAAVLLALHVRANVPISAALVWISNPVTIPPLLYLAYQLGMLAMGGNAPQGEPWAWENMADVLRTIWQPLFLGCGIFAIVSGALGYLTVNILWRTSVLRKRRCPIRAKQIAAFRSSMRPIAGRSSRA